jgi:Tfp pilus assembly protein PilF
VSILKPENRLKLFFINYHNFWGSLFLAAITLAVYWPVQNHDFVNFDDDIYVIENSNIHKGLTTHSVVWAFSFKDKEGTYWQPITWLSHSLDCQLYELQPGKHHLTSLVIHLANSILLFIIFKWMTRVFWRSLLLATLFAIHPINVDSVAWVAERKNVLSTFFWMLTMLCYVYYVKKPGLYKYLLTLLMYVLGLLTKPMLVTLPFVLLLLDYWPLKRFLYGQASRNGTGVPNKTAISGLKITPPFRLILEKIPFLALSVLSIILSSLSMQEKVYSSTGVPLDLRIANALVSYVKYICNMFWPEGLTVFYPFPQMVPIWEVLGALFFLVFASFFAIRTIKKAPYFIIGWLWFLGTFVPVLGLVQVGLWPAMADRFAYVPLIGLFIILVWGVPQICQNLSHHKIWIPTSVSLLVLVLIILTWKQVGYWRNSITLFEHNLKYTKNNYTAHNNLGNALNKQNRTQEAIQHYSKALQIKPDHFEAHNNLGNALNKQNRTQEAIQHYLKALQLKPDFAKAHNNLGNTLSNKGRIQEAINHYLQALRINPDDGEVQNNLGVAFCRMGNIEEGITHFRKALRINPADNSARTNLKRALTIQQRMLFKRGNTK